MPGITTLALTCYHSKADLCCNSFEDEGPFILIILLLTLTVN